MSSKNKKWMTGFGKQSAKKMGDWFHHNQHKMAIDKNTDRNLNGSWRTEEFRPIKSRANILFYKEKTVVFNGSKSRNSK